MTVQSPVPVLRFEEIDSTNLEAARRAASGASAPLWIVAARQSAGRGRAGREWLSERGNLLATLLLRPGCAPAVAAQHSFLAALATAEAIEPDCGGAAVALKWPNDVLADGRKLCGLLLESGGQGGRADWLAIGVGVNVAHAPGQTRLPAAHLREFSPQASAEGVFIRLQTRFEYWLAVFAQQGFAPIRAAWLARAARLGEEIEARLIKETHRGVFAGLDAEGALLLDAPAGRMTIHAADIYFP